jgi:hypothetical protein
MKPIRYLFPVSNLALICLALAGCAQVDSSKVAPSEVYTSYSATYSEDNSRVTVTAYFTVGKGFGTQVALDGGSTVNVNGSQMHEQSDLFGGVFYDYNRTIYAMGDLLSPFTIRYSDNSGRTYTNGARIPSRVMANPTPYHGGDLVISWNAYDNLGVNENISATLEAGGKTIFATDHYGGNHGLVIFRASDMATINDSSATVTVCRKSSSDAVEAPSVGGYMNLSYCASTMRISLR